MSASADGSVPIEIRIDRAPLSESLPTPIMHEWGRRAAMPSLQTVALACYPVAYERAHQKVDRAGALLPPIERAELVEGILQSLDATDPNLDQLWAEAAKDRLAAYRRGELEALDFDETLAKHASRP